MNESLAASKADDLLRLILIHQSGVVRPNVLLNKEDALSVAENIAALRQKLIEGLFAQNN